LTIYAKPDIIYAVGNTGASPQTVEQEAEKEYRINHNCTWDSWRGGRRNWDPGTRDRRCLLLLAMDRWTDGSMARWLNKYFPHTPALLTWTKSMAVHGHTSMSGRLHTMQMRSHKSVKVMANKLGNEELIL